MLFKIVAKEAFKTLVEIVLETDEIIAPKQVGTSAAGKPIHQFLPIARFEEMDLSYETTELSAKTYFLPYKETLSTYSFDDEDWEQTIRYRIQPRAVLGLHACDINALLKLDRVFERSAFPSPYYVSRRRNTFIVGIDHPPCDRGFCQSVDADVVSEGFDLFLTDLGDRYFVAVASDRGFRLIQRVEARDVSDADTQDYIVQRRRFAEGFETEVNVKNLPYLLDLEFEFPVWARWGDKCLSCGSCAMVCPTCYCYGVSERVDMDFRRGQKVKQLYSCNLIDFAEVAGGHNFRPTRSSRLKYRYYHQHRGFADEQEPKCVGCNRCGRVCLAGINPPDVIRDLHLEKSP
ncbi:MAG: 4Fe-4S dicluster domain-containing protein [bacterium]